MNDLAAATGEPVIRMHALRKVYRLYRQNFHRLLDFFHLLPQDRGLYSEHVALDDVHVEIQRGEKVALIGRNGAGKSTFLKVVTGVTEPTSGLVEVRGTTHALLQIGTGFHPDFTGRENVVSYLAHQGISEADSQAHVQEIIDFAELEEYIDQPLKTYSTGMGARLMFAASTVLQPDLLVLDEVLGVGDAYFAQKSYDRIRELCSGGQTTVLLVSHDIYSAARICDRMIWIDRGRVLIDADSPSVIKAYEESVREQEEQRLRARKLLKLARQSERATTVPVLVEIRSLQNEPLPCPVQFARLELEIDGTPIGRVSFGAEAFDESAPAHLVREGSAWSDAATFDGRPAASFMHHGSVYRKVAAVFSVPREILSSCSTVACQLEYRSEYPCRLGLRALAPGRQLDLGILPEPENGWQFHTCYQVSADDRHPPDVNSSGRHGTGRIDITNVRTRNSSGTETCFLRHGESVDFEIDYQINDDTLCEHAGVMVVLHRNGVEDVCRLVTLGLLFDANVIRTGTIQAHLEQFPAGPGNYTVSVLISREGYYTENDGIYFSINPGVYACLSRVAEIVVQGGGLESQGTAVMLSADWKLTASESGQKAGHHAA